MTFGTTEIVVTAIGGAALYLVLSLFAGGLPIKHGGIRAAAMAFWPVTVLCVLCYLPILVWQAAAEDTHRKLSKE